MHCFNSIKRSDSSRTVTGTTGHIYRPHEPAVNQRTNPLDNWSRQVLIVNPKILAFLTCDRIVIWDGLSLGQQRRHFPDYAEEGHF